MLAAEIAGGVIATGVVVAVAPGMGAKIKEAVECPTHRTKQPPPPTDAFGRGYTAPGSIPVDLACVHLGDIPEGYNAAGVLRRKMERQLCAPALCACRSTFF